MDETNKSLGAGPAEKVKNMGRAIGPVHLSYNPYFSAYFFSWISVFLSQQVSRNSVSVCFFSKANGASCPLSVQK